jgi:hypothetical protein
MMLAPAGIGKSVRNRETKPASRRRYKAQSNPFATYVLIDPQN